MSTQHQRERAATRVNQYRHNPHPCAWSHIDPDELAEQLLQRIDDPYCMAQVDSGWCGPTAVCASLAKDAPAAYAKMVIDLVRHGRALVQHGHCAGLELTPPADLRHYAFQQTGIATADWVALSSLRDSLRSSHERFIGSDFLHSETFKHGHCHAGEVVDFYKSLGYREVHNFTSRRNLSGPHVRQFADEANTFLRRHYRVTMRINDNMLHDDRRMHKRGEQYSHSVEITTHNHWVDLIGKIHIAGVGQDAPVSFHVFSWGERQRVGHQHTGKHLKDLSVEELGINWFGFVCAKY